MSRRNGYVAAVAGAAIALAIRLGLDATFGDRTFLILYVPVVLVAAGLGGRGPAFLATLLCLGISAAILQAALWLDPANLVDALAFALLGPFIALVGERLWRDGREAATRQAHLQSILETVPEAMIVIDAAGTMQSFSTAAIRLFGWTPDEAIGRNVSLLMPEPYRSEHDHYLERYLGTGDAGSSAWGASSWDSARTVRPSPWSWPWARRRWAAAGSSRVS